MSEECATTEVKAERVVSASDDKGRECPLIHRQNHSISMFRNELTTLKDHFSIRDHVKIHSSDCDDLHKVPGKHHGLGAIGVLGKIGDFLDNTDPLHDKSSNLSKTFDTVGW